MRIFVLPLLLLLLLAVSFLCCVFGCVVSGAASTTTTSSRTHPDLRMVIEDEFADVLEPEMTEELLQRAREVGDEYHKELLSQHYPDGGCPANSTIREGDLVSMAYVVTNVTHVKPILIGFAAGLVVPEKTLMKGCYTALLGACLGDEMFLVLPSEVGSPTLQTPLPGVGPEETVLMRLIPVGREVRKWASSMYRKRKKRTRFADMLREQKSKGQADDSAKEEL